MVYLYIMFVTIDVRTKPTNQISKKMDAKKNNKIYYPKKAKCHPWNSLDWLRIFENWKFDVYRINSNDSNSQ